MILLICFFTVHSYGEGTTKKYTNNIYTVFFSPGATTPSGPEPPHSRGFYITHNEAPQSVGLLWMSDQTVSETST
jgi:hypothetical protein